VKPSDPQKTGKKANFLRFLVKTAKRLFFAVLTKKLRKLAFLPVFCGFCQEKVLSAS
jgi:hypothetical protein